MQRIMRKNIQILLKWDSPERKKSYVGGGID